MGRGQFNLAIPVHCGIRNWDGRPWMAPRVLARRPYSLLDGPMRTCERPQHGRSKEAPTGARIRVHSYDLLSGSSSMEPPAGSTCRAMRALWACPATVAAMSISFVRANPDTLCIHVSTCGFTTFALVPEAATGANCAEPFIRLGFRVAPVPAISAFRTPNGRHRATSEFEAIVKRLDCRMRCWP